MNTFRYPLWNTMAYHATTIVLLVGLVLIPVTPPAPLPITQVADGVHETDITPHGVHLPPGTNADWWAVAQGDIRQSEYRITWREYTALADLTAAYQAPNRAHNLLVYFTPEGIRLIPRQFEGEIPPWEWGLSLSGYGYADGVQPVAPATLHSQGQRFEYRRGDPSVNPGQVLTEWYLNDERGLEQGFTLHAPPSPPQGDGQSEAVVLELALRGDLTPHLSADGTAVEFTTSGSVHVLHYGELVVSDATGRRLPAQLELTPGGMRISFEANGAVYPITVDPLATSPSWTAESNQASAYFGFSVGTAGDVNGDGYSDLVIGAYGYDNGQADEGRAFVYHGGPGGLSASPDWTAESDQAGAQFGYAVGTAGDVDDDGYDDLVVSAPYYSNGQTLEGGTFVYHGGPGGLSASPDWIAESNQGYANFGFSVGTAGDVNGDGYSDLVVGSPYYDNGQYNEGRAFVYHGGTGGLSATPAWMTESDQEDAVFGWSVRTAGDVNGDGYSDLVVGAPAYNNTQVNEGRVYVYHGSPGGLSASPDWTAEGDQAIANFGYSVGTAGDVNGDGYSDLVVGAPYYDNDQYDEGRAHVYHGGSGGLSASPAWITESDQEYALLGWSVGTTGDVNGDGYSDLVVGAHLYTNDQEEEGQAYVFHGGPDGLSASPDWTAEGDQAYAYLGVSVGTAGDVDGDGYSDLVIGAYQYDNGQNEEGRVYVYQSSDGEHLVYLPTVSREVSSYFEGPWEQEPNNTFSQANGPLRSGQDYFGYPDQYDLFSIRLYTGGVITVDLADHSGQGVSLALYDQSQQLVDQETPTHLEYTAQPGLYYVYIYTASGHNNNIRYILRVTYPR